MSVTIEIESVDRTAEVEQLSPSYSQVATKAPGVLRFAMKGSKISLPSLGDDVLMKIGGANEYHGTVVEVKETVLENMIPAYQYVCMDGYYALDAQLVSKSYNDTTARAVINDIVTNFASGFTLDMPTTSPTVKSIRFNYEQPSRCIQKICNETGWDWYVDADDVVHVFPPDTSTASISVTDDNGEHFFKEFKFDQNIVELRNLVYVRGGEYLDEILEADAVDVYEADGAQQAFPLVYRYSNVNVKLDSVAQTVGVDYISDPADFDCLYNYQEKLVRFPDGTLSGGEVLKVYGDAHVPLIVQAVDEDSVVAYGERQGIEINKSIDSIEEAELLAYSLLEKWREGAREGTFETTTTGLRVGQSISIQSTAFGIDDTYKINRIDGYMRNHDEFRYVVEFIKSGQTTLTDMLIGLIGKERDNVTISPDEVIQRFRQLDDTLGITDEIVSVDTDSPPYHYGPVTTGNEGKYNFATYT